MDAKPASTPLPPGFKFSQDDGSLLPCPEQYRRLVGRLLYLGFFRPDISFFVQQLSQFLQHPHTSHWNAAIHVLRYLKGTLSLGLFFSAHGSFQLTAYSDASCVACLDTRRSITGFCIFLGSSLISSKMKKQATVSHSFAEAAVWVPQFAALHIIGNSVFHKHTKHPDVDCHLVRDQFKLGFIAPSHVPSSQQLADVFTKAVFVADFTRLIIKLGLVVSSLRGCGNIS
ncbi:UNVERIFIED_CONTAM: Retrovirus-related Pol polyprotein from transposon RE2 [Sesamum angustifolium]|uniref:Retrovirus-related Pol polyprotein from transposon RE2 n=1 Tax=Sesamum angustifolium TaxID=2727405 RepID=A0AAW2IU38_9LAMI